MGPQIEILDGRVPDQSALLPRPPGRAGAAQWETSLRDLAERMLRDRREVAEAVRCCFARPDARPEPGEDEKTFGRRLLRIIIDEALRIQREQQGDCEPALVRR